MGCDFKGKKTALLFYHLQISSYSGFASPNPIPVTPETLAHTEEAAKIGAECN